MSSAPSVKEQSRYEYLDGLRGWAALAVVLHHGLLAVDFALYSGEKADSRNSWDQWLSGTPLVPLATAGDLAVSIFFVLSGFVLAHAYSRSDQGLLALATRRYTRLWIPMSAGCLLSWALLVSGTMHPHEAASITHSPWLGSQFHQAPDVLSALAEPTRRLLSLPVAGSQTYDSSLWTMPLEAGGSVLLMAVFVGLRHRGRWTKRSALSIFLLLTVIFANSYISLFAFGAALRLIQSSELVGKLRTSKWIPIGFILIGLFMGTVPYSNSTERLPIYNSMLSFSKFVVEDAWLWWPVPGSLRWQQSPQGFWHGLAAMLILLAAVSSPPIQAALSGPFGRFLGRISFPLYIFHVPLLMAVECGALLICNDAGLSPLTGAVVSVSVFVLCAVAVSAGLAPLVEGGAVSFSASVGKCTDSLSKRIVARGANFFRALPGA